MQLNARLVVAWLALTLPVTALVAYSGHLQAVQIARLQGAHLAAAVRAIAERQGLSLRLVDQTMANLAANLTFGIECQPAIERAHATISGHVAGLLLMSAEGEVLCGVPDDAIGRRIEPALMTEVAQSNRPRWGRMTVGEVSGLALVPVLHLLEVPGRQGRLVLASGVRVDAMQRPAEGADGISLAWLDADGAVIRSFKDDDPGARFAPFAELSAAPPGTALQVDGSIHAMAAVSPDIWLVGRVDAATLGHAVLRQAVWPAMVTLALLLTALALSALLLKRWIIEPARQLDRAIMHGPARPPMPLNLPPEFSRVLATAAARDTAWLEAVRLRDTLVAELNHRVANTLQIVVSLLRNRAASLGGSPGAIDALREAEYRVSTIALLHRLLRATAEETFVDVKTLLWSVGDILVTAFGMADRVTVKVEGDAGILGMREALPVALLVNEWVSESLLVAFPGGRAGSLRIALFVAGDERELCYGDDGERDENLDSGTTDTLVMQLAAQLNGTVRRQADGVWRYRLVMRPRQRAMP